MVLVSLRGRLFGDDIEELGSQNTNVTVVKLADKLGVQQPNRDFHCMALCALCQSDNIKQND